MSRKGLLAFRIATVFISAILGQWIDNGVHAQPPGPPPAGALAPPPGPIIPASLPAPPPGPPGPPAGALSPPPGPFALPAGPHAPRPAAALAPPPGALAPPPGPPAPPPGPPADLEQRLRELEATVQRLRAERTTSPAATDAPRTGADSLPLLPPSPLERTPPAAAATSGATKLTAGWSDGFFIRSEDELFNLRITGQLQADYRAFLDGRDYTDIDSFLVRRARLGIEANVFKYFEFRLLPDFSNNQGPGVVASTRIQDAYINVHYWDEFQVETGKFKQPFSYEQLIQDRFVPTAERSLIDQLVPSRDEGLMIHGQKLFADRFDYYLAVSNGEINGDFDQNKNKDVNLRLVYRPFNDPDILPPLKGIQIGGSFGWGEEQEPVNPSTLKTPATIPFFAFNSTVRAAGLRTRYSPEVAYFFRGLGLAAQYYHQEQRLQPAFTGPTSRFVEDLPMEGFYVMGTYLLTGEERTTYSAPVVPLRAFDPCQPLHCPGAWELVGRVSHLHIGDSAFAAGPQNLANPALYSPDATELTLGFNWYLNAWVRTQFNWERSWFTHPVRLGPGPDGLLKHDDAIIARFQVIF
jgi:phosphate-selective porin OprO/OprP